MGAKRKEPDSRPRVLVLGGQAPGLRICTDLGDLGFQAISQSEAKISLPEPGQKGWIELARAKLRTLRGYSAIHPGTSAWAERPELIELARSCDLEVIGPPTKVVSLFCNKLALLEFAEKQGIPNLVLTYDPIHSVREVQKLVEQLSSRFPFVLKSVQGLSRFGVQVLHSEEQLVHELPLWLEQMRARLGEVILFAERYLSEARYITVPFARMPGGKVQIFPLVDASLQSRFRKIVEFCPTDSVDEQVLERIYGWTEKLAEATGYLGVGALEFLVDGSRAYLIEGLSRLSGSFPLWESVSGSRAVAWQVAAMEGAHTWMKAPQIRPALEWRHGTYLRIRAEDPLLELPQSGKIFECEVPPSTDRVEIEVAVEPGSVVLPEHDGVLATVLALGESRDRALNQALGVLGGIWISGAVGTTEKFLGELLAHPWVREGMFHASFVDEEFVPEPRQTRGLAAILIEVAHQLIPDVQGKQIWVGGTRLAVQGRSVEWSEPPKMFKVGKASGLRGVLNHLRVTAYPLSSSSWQVRIGSSFFVLKKPKPVSPALSAGSLDLSALVSGRVHSVLFREGSVVQPHEHLLMVEAAQKLVAHAIPIQAQILKWHVKAGDLVEARQKIATIEACKKL